MYINVGASYDGERIKTKTLLRKLCKESPADVTFDATAIRTDAQWSGRATEIPDGMRLSVAGPDPYTNRRWYAIVAREANGKVTVT